RSGCRAGVYQHDADRRLLPTDEDHRAANPADLPLASSSDHRPCEALCAGIAAGTGSGDPLPADVADDSSYPGPIEGSALPHAREDHCAKYTGDCTDGRTPAKLRRSPAAEDSG